MGNMHMHECHISCILGQMVKKWCEVLPEGVRALEKFNRENNSVLVQETAIKQKILASIKLKNFKGTASGQRVDLSVYTQVFEPISYEATEQERLQADKEGS